MMDYIHIVKLFFFSKNTLKSILNFIVLFEKSLKINNNDFTLV